MAVNKHKDAINILEKAIANGSMDEQVKVSLERMKLLNSKN